MNQQGNQHGNQQGNQPSSGPLLSGPEPVPRLRRREQASTGVAVVLRNGKGAMVAEWPHRRLEGWEVSKARVMWKVDISPHHERLRFDPYSKGLVHRFQVEVALTWQVHDPVAVIEQNVTDPLTDLRELLGPVADEVARQYAAPEGQPMLEHLERRLAGWPLKLGNGITASAPHVTVHLDKRHRETAVQLTDIGHTTEVTRERQVLDDLQWTHIANRRRHETMLEIELRKARIGAYLGYLEQGLGDPAITTMIALKLAEHPGDVDAALEDVSAWDQRRRQVTVTALEAMLNARELQGFDLQPARDAVLRLLDGLRDTLPDGQPRQVPRPVRARMVSGGEDENGDDEDADGQPEDPDGRADDANGQPAGSGRPAPAGRHGQESDDDDDDDDEYD